MPGQTDVVPLVELPSSTLRVTGRVPVPGPALPCRARASRVGWHRCRPETAHIPHVTSGPYPLREGNFVRPLVDGEAAFGRICEAVESAERSAWVTVAFIDRDIQMPGGRGTFFDVLDRAAERGIDVRALFWRFEPHGAPRIVESAFRGDEQERAWLKERGSRWMARWDHNPGYCHHQKSWVVDAGRTDRDAFVGGINLHTNSVVPAGHPYLDHPWGSTHDVYMELRGPAATDVHHNFVQRWNEASEREHDHGTLGSAGETSTFPTRLRPRPGAAAVQVSRTVRRGAYSDSTATPGGEPHAIADGDSSILDQYITAIDAAQESIYLENQAIGHALVVSKLAEALERGVDVTFLVPGRPHPDMIRARKPRVRRRSSSRSRASASTTTSCSPGSPATSRTAAITTSTFTRRSC